MQIKDQLLLKNIGFRIRKIRKKRNLSQVQLAVLIDNHAEQIGRIERGKLNVTICTLQLIAKGLNTNIINLLGVEEPFY